MRESNPPSGPRAMRDTTNVPHARRYYQQNAWKKRIYSHFNQDDNQGGDRGQKKARNHQYQEDRAPQPIPRKQNRPAPPPRNMSQPPRGIFGNAPALGMFEAAYAVNAGAAQATFVNPFGTPTGTATPPTTTSFNPFAPKPPTSTASSTNFGKNAFETKKPIHNPFAPNSSNSASSTTIQNRPLDSFKSFGAPSQPSIFPTTPKDPPAAGANVQPAKPFGIPFGTTFGTSSSPSASPFSAPAQQATPSPSASPFSAPTQRAVSSSSASLFSAPTQQSASKFQNRLPKSKLRFGEAPKAANSSTAPQPRIKKSASSSMTDGASSLIPLADRATSEVMKQRVEAALKSNGLQMPPMPKVGVNTDRAAWEMFTKDLRAYRERYKKILMEANILDDPDVRKPLEDAYDFKGTCTTMCPYLEAAERMVERRYDQFEKDHLADGSFSAEPNFNRMIKKFGRSAAGQDERLPMEVRTVDTLAKTLDYLIDDLIPTFDLPKVHEFIWDRTRGIRRDLVYPTFYTDSEMNQRVNILENIARFHVVSLHLMSKEASKPASYNAFQDREQLANTLKSLREAYEECMDRKLECKNRPEFLAYYVLLLCEDSSVLQKAQDWGMELWGKSQVFQTAISLVEACKNISDTHGPLKNPATGGYTQLDIALSAFTKFFTIVEDSSVSYQMACFAEMYFNSVRMSIIRSILHAYRRQKDQTKDWTLSRLNAHLRFDDESDIVPWGEMHGLHFENGEEEEYLSFSASSLKKASPEAPQQHSYALVECKRGGHSLSELIRTTVFGVSEEDEYGPIAEDDGEDDTTVDPEAEGLFVKDYSIEPESRPVFQPGSLLEEDDESNEQQKEQGLEQPKTNSVSTNTTTNAAVPVPNDSPKLNSVFGGFGSPKTTGFPTSQDTLKAKENPPSLFAKPATAMNAGLAKTTQEKLPAQSPAGLSKPLFGFLSQPNPTLTPEPVVNPAKSLFNFSASPTTIAPESGTNGKKPTESPNPTTILKPQSPATKEQTVPAEKVSFSPSLDKTPVIESPVQSPLPTNGSISNAASFTNTATAPQTGSLNKGPALPIVPETAPSNNPSKMATIANWVALGEGGLMDQFTEFITENLLRATAEQFMAEQQKLEDEKAAEASRLEADEFRQRILAARYFSRWREVARRAGLKRRGREGRRRRREMAIAMAAEKANIVEDFRASTRPQEVEEEVNRLEEFQTSASASRRLSRERRESLESLLHDAAVQALIQEKVEQEVDRRESSSKKRPRSEQSFDHLASGIRHKRDRSDNPLGRSLLSDATYLNGGSRMHLASNYSDQIEDRHDASGVSGVESDYFRLKARGVSTVPDGRRSARKDVVHKKHKFDGITKSTRSKIQAWAQPLTPEVAIESRTSQSSVEYERHRRSTNGFENLLSKGKSKQVDALDDFDRELFARCKQSRDALGAGEEYRDISEELLEAEWKRVQSEKKELKRQEEKVQAEWSRIQGEKKRLKHYSRSLS